jgi:transcriptional regulator with XRE-family HTH domain
MPSDFAKQFGAVVRKRRLNARLSQEKLAEVAGLHPTYISMVERGVRNPTLDVADKIARALDIALSRLIEQAQKHRVGARGKKLQ